MAPPSIADGIYKTFLAKNELSTELLLTLQPFFSKIKDLKSLVDMIQMPHNKVHIARRILCFI